MKNEILREDKKIISTYFRIFFKFMFSRVLFQLDRKRNKIIIMVSIELNLKIIVLCQKYLIEIHVFLKRKKKKRRYII